MTQLEYARLTEACDRLLHRNSANAVGIALPWLHVLSEHPNNLRHYESVFHGDSLLRRLRLKLRHLASIVLTLLRCLKDPMRDVTGSDASFPRRLDVVIVSHLVSEHVTADAPDFYFGGLAEQLTSRGISSLLALHNHLPGRQRALRARLTRGGPAARVLLPRWFTLRGELALLRTARGIRRALLEQASAATCPLEARVAREAANYANAGSTLATLRAHGVIRELCARFRPKALIVTWEGHAWERLAFHAARSVDPDISCVGYQHTVLFPRSHALARPLGRAYDPTVIVTAGEINREVLAGRATLSGVKLLTYGTHRRNVRAAPRLADASARCVVIPEGLEPECLTLFDFAIVAARELPTLEFVLRTHPVLPFRSLARRHPRLRRLPPNVTVSTHADITADFARCDWALYRGSSAVVHAVLAGVRPVYLQQPGESLIIDPLFAMKSSWRRRIEDVGALSRLVDEDRVLARQERLGEWEPAREFCDRYFIAPDLGVVESLLAA